MSRLLETFAVIWRLAHPYFFSDDRWPGRALLTGVIAVELSLVTINVLISHWQNRFYNSLQDRAWGVFVNELMFFGSWRRAMSCSRSISSICNNGCRSAGAPG